MDKNDSIGFERTVGPTRASGAGGPALRDGEVFGPFRVVCQLGRGTMGEVYKVTRIKEGNDVALKVMAAELMRDDRAVARFRQEARTLYVLNHTNIVTSFQAGEENGRHWLTMQLCDGLEVVGADGQPRQVRSLDEYAEVRGGVLTQAELLTTIEDVLAGLAYAHEHGIVHRDLKPANILLARSAKERPFRALISDFGLVRIVGEESIRAQVERSIGLSLTHGAVGAESKAWLGNWAYMSPEQKRGQPATKASDLYAVGLLAYRLGTGNDLGLEAASELNPDLVPEWDAFIGKALEELPENRYASAQEMRTALGRVRAAWEQREAARHASDKPQSTRRARMGLGLAAVAALVILSLASFKSFQSRRVAERAAIEQAAKLAAAQREKAEAERLAAEKAEAEVARRVKESADAAALASAAKMKSVGPKEGEAWASPGTGMEFVWIPALKIWVGKYEVTNGEYRKKESGHDSKDYKVNSLNGDRQPVVYVNFDDVVAYAVWLTERDKAQLCRMRYRVISEQEWLMAAQCGDGREYPWGKAMPPKCGNYSKTSDYDDGDAVTCPVEKSGINDWGLYGVGGNVWECCAKDVSGSSFGGWRGASWGNGSPDLLRCAFRIDFGGSSRNNEYGFRLVLSRDDNTMSDTPMFVATASEFKSKSVQTTTEAQDPVAETQNPAVRAEPKEGTPWTSPAAGMEFVWIPALKIWVGKYEVTNNEYRKKEPSHDSKGYGGNSLNGDRQPVVYVNFDDAVAYAAWLTERDKDKLGGMRYRVPSKAEWVVFAQCGDGRVYPWGNTWPPKYGNYSASAAKSTWGITGIDGYTDGYAVTCPVEKSGVNDWGLYGVGGNVWECCATDASGSSFVAWRGASWLNNDPECLRCAPRLGGGVSSNRNYIGGFRLVVSRNDNTLSNTPMFVATASELKVKSVQPTTEVQKPTIRADPKVGGGSDTVDLGNGISIELVCCPPGSFMMGSPSTETDRGSDETQHQVTLTKGFWMGKTEVTQAQWEAIMGNNPSNFKGSDLPVERVSWEDCQAFVRKLNAKMENGKWKLGKFRLPTEAEWEYACRAGSTGLYAGSIDEMGWSCRNSGRATQVVGRKRANAWGLYDMHGNVWEWCQDWYGEYASGSVTDPAGAAWCAVGRVNRGGGCNYGQKTCRSAYRYRTGPSYCDDYLGLRLVVSR